MCGGEDETEDHLWFGCAYVMEVSNLLLRWVEHRESTLPDWLAWFGRDHCPKSFMFESKLLILSAIVYYTCRARNVKIFE